MNIIIVDDDKLVSLSLKTILEASGEVNVCAIGNCGEEALSLYPKFKPDILLMDIRMDGMSGLTAGKQILETYPDAKILFLTTFSDDEYIVKALDEYIVRALRMGAKGYLLKQNFESILPALQAVQKGQTVFGEEITDKIPDLINKTTAQRDFAKYGITEKEYAIIEQVANGLNNKEIAETLYLSEGTVRNYLSSILEKLELRDRTQLAIFYYR